MEHHFKGIIGKVEDSTLMWNYRIQIPDDIMDSFRDTDKRIVSLIKGTEPVHCAIFSQGDGTYYIMINKQFRTKYKLVEGDEVEVSISKDDSKYGTKAPDFFEELCFQDPIASDYFHLLTPGKQRTLLHLMCKLKSEEKQLEKALVIFDYLKEVEGKLDFKELNEAFKSNRFKN
ncbi:DUF1905 domain-containing protein [Paracrocinitomix mangrovi]|uniref:DUF1905 domain-containing protein n=1 Tax=Paracrocinitomix mangrovi TaxID=2862509 RepID=UPI001C8D8547|nr:DUF1905 domain-containing protein [Paracrocinitomix mangrovi]UKN02364.1 DUF1905 domain-containing protein [Paracrocinitomix mangrovi]